MEMLHVKPTMILSFDYTPYIKYQGSSSWVINNSYEKGVTP